MKSCTTLHGFFTRVGIAVILSAALASESAGSLYRLDDAAGVLTVIGQGRPPLGVQHEAQARLMAERAAILDAYGTAVRVLSERMPRVLLEQQGYSAFLRGGRIARSERVPDGSVKVELEIPLSRELAGRFREVVQQAEAVAVPEAKTVGIRHADFVARHRVLGPRPITIREWVDRYRSGSWAAWDR